MAWVDANTKLYFPKVLNLDAISRGYNGEITNIIHYKRLGVEYTESKYMGYIGGYTAEEGWLAFISEKPRLQYDISESGRNGWGIRTASGWEDGLDELVYITFPEDPNNYVGTKYRLENYIALGAYWENEVEEETTDLQPVYKRVNGEWIKQNAYKRVDGAWVQISEKESGVITDLTGTTWNVPTGYTVSSGYGVFNIDGTLTVSSVSSSQTYNITKFAIGYSPSTAGNYIGWEQTNGSKGNINNFSYFGLVLEITGGTDATNADLIAWLYANGELQ